MSLPRLQRRTRRPWSTSMFTQGSRWVIIAREVTACMVAAPLSRITQHLGHPAPELACGTEFRDRHELVVIGDQPEADLTQRLGHPRPAPIPAAEGIPPRQPPSPRSPAGIGAPRSWNAGPSTVTARTPSCATSVPATASTSSTSAARRPLNGAVSGSAPRSIDSFAPALESAPRRGPGGRRRPPGSRRRHQG